MHEILRAEDFSLMEVCEPTFTTFSAIISPIGSSVCIPILFLHGGGFSGVEVI